jgi:hypothetical protein
MQAQRMKYYKITGRTFSCRSDEVGVVTVPFRPGQPLQVTFLPRVGSEQQETTEPKGESISIAFDELRNISSQGTGSPPSKGAVGGPISSFQGSLMLKRCLGPCIFVPIHLKTTHFPDKPSYKWNGMGITGNTYGFTLSL